MFFLNGTLKKSGSVGRWETKQFIGMAKQNLSLFATLRDNFKRIILLFKTNSDH